MQSRNRVLLASLLLTSLVAYGCTETNNGGSGGSGGVGGSGGSGGAGGVGGVGGVGGSGGSGGAGGSGGSGGAGGGGPACADFNGTYVVTEQAPCSMGALLKSACVAQNDCTLTVSTNMGVMTGTVDGDVATFSGELSHLTTKFPYECTAKLENGSLALDCTITTTGSTCAIALPEQALPAGATSACCDLVGQNCGAGSECTLVDPAGAKKTYFSVCEAVGGAVAEGAACTRTAFGEDNCAPGLLCTDDAKAPNNFACREYCAKASDCDAGELCLAYWTGSPLAGVCIPTCTPFGNGCEAGSTCRDRNSLTNDGIVDISGAGGFACGHAGPVLVGEICKLDADCGVNARCGVDSSMADGNKRCVAYCDNAHACSGGKSCSAYFIPGYMDFGECQ